MRVVYLQLDSSSSAGCFLAFLVFQLVPSAQGRPGLSANPFGLGDRKATHSRLGPAKVPQLGVDLINMAV